MSPQEPLVEPLDKPTGRAREPGDQGFEAGLAAYPDSGRKRTDDPAARASWALACQEVEPERLTAAIGRYAAEDADLRHGDFGAPAFEKWLAGKRWRPWLEVGASAPTAPAAAVFDGPDWLREAVVAQEGDGFARTYLDLAHWRDGPPARLIPRTGVAESELKRRLRLLLAAHEIIVERELAG